MQENLQSKLEELLDDANSWYSKPASVLDRIKVLTPMFTALSAGYIFCGYKLVHISSPSYGTLFWAPFSIGCIILITSIFQLLHGLVSLSGLEQMPEPKAIFDDFHKLNNAKGGDDGEESNAIEKFQESYVFKKAKIAQCNFKKLESRSALIDVASKLGMCSFGLIIFSLLMNLILTSIQQ